MSISKTTLELIEKAKAGYPAIYLETPDDFRGQKEIAQAAEELKRDLYFWTFGKGLTKSGKTSIPIPETSNPPEVLSYLLDNASKKEKSVIILRIFHEFLDDPLIKSLLLDLVPKFKESGKMIVITAPVIKLPPEVEKEFALISSPLPDKIRMYEILDGIVSGSGFTGSQIPEKETRDKLVESAMGLTAGEAENALSLACVRPKLRKENKNWDPSVVMEEKCQSLKKTGLLEYIPVSSKGLNEVGGLKLLKQWVGKRKNAFSDEAKAYGLPHPKGILMVGPPGSGKSLSAKAISGELGLPLLRMDMGKMFGSLVGQSESNTRQAIQIAEALSPVVLWVDEIEKGMAGSNAGSLDSGVGARVLSTLLTWMQEKTAPVFVLATSNDVTGLPPELLRKGRFDDLFSVTFPTPSERKEIFKIHIAKRGRGKLVEENKIDLDLLVRESSGFSGAEIEACIVESMYTAFSENREINQYDICQVMDTTVPMSEMMKEKLSRLSEWCKKRARPASESELEPKDMEMTTRRVESN